MTGFGKYKISWKEWMCFTLLFFFLYDVIWAIADFENFSLYLNGHYLYILADLVYCGLFSLLSLSANHVLLLTSSLRTPKFFVKEFSYFLMPCHQHGLRINLLVQR